MYTSFEELDGVRDHKNMEISSEDRERVYLKTGPDPRSPEISIETEPEPDIQVMHEDIDERESMYKRIQAEIQNGNKETRAQDEEMLEIPPEGDEVSYLIMDKGGVLRANLRLEKLKREEISIGRRNRRYGEDIRTDKREHYPSVSWRIQHPHGFYAEEWSEDKQEEDDWQAPDKLQRTSNMVFRNVVQEIPPVKDGVSL